MSREQLIRSVQQHFDSGAFATDLARPQIEARLFPQSAKPRRAWLSLHRSVVFLAKKPLFPSENGEKTPWPSLDCTGISISIRDTSVKARFPLGNKSTSRRKFNHGNCEKSSR